MKYQTNGLVAPLNNLTMEPTMTPSEMYQHLRQKVGQNDTQKISLSPIFFVDSPTPAKADSNQQRDRVTFPLRIQPERKHAYHE